MGPSQRSHVEVSSPVPEIWQQFSFRLNGNKMELLKLLDDALVLSASVENLLLLMMVPVYYVYLHKTHPALLPAIMKEEIPRSWFMLLPLDRDFTRSLIRP